MQKGIGRTGFFLLALVLFVVGAFGAMLTWSAFQQGATAFFWMGLGVIGTALTGLFLFSTVALGTSSMEDRPKAPVAAPPAPVAAPTPAPAPEAKAMDYEFDEFEPAAKAAPEQMIVPDAFQEAPEGPVTFTPRAAPERDPAAWPQKAGKSSWTRQVEHRRGVEAQMDDSGRRKELAEKYTRTTPMLRSIMEEKAAEPLPPTPTAPARAAPRPEAPQAREHIAERAPGDMNTDFVAPGMSIGQCGQCRTLLLAPEERPLRLKCPECAKVTLLQ